MAVTLTSTMAANVLPKEYGGMGALPKPRLLAGTALTYFGLSILGSVAPTLAKPIAAAIAVTAVTYYGFPLLNNWFNGAHDPVGRIP